MTTTAPAAVDAKAGFCSFCRGGNHALCASETCACSQTRHPGRHRSGGAARPTPPRPPKAAGKSPPAPPKPARPTEPVWELVRADPPTPPPKMAERVRPMLEQLMAEENREWHRVVIFPKPGSAGYVKGRLAKLYPREWEWKAVRLDDVGQSAIYVRWRGGGKRMV